MKSYLIILQSFLLRLNNYQINEKDQSRIGNSDNWVATGYTILLSELWSLAK